ncbi:hypothetical protein J0E37_000222 [Campylobacter upsaliensis]|nr:hypothetical protein [Campylobacter upsaliensis]
MKKFLSLSVFCAIYSYADYQTKFPNTSITLTQDETHKAQVQCYNQQCAFNYNGNNGGYSLTLSGNYTLSITKQDPVGGITTPNKDISI